MIWLLIPLLCSTLLPAQEESPAPERQFDFWVGEWRVHNRTLNEDRWEDAGTAKARIRPILGGAAILEEWLGLDGARADTFGISLRFHDPSTQRWVIALNWPGPRGALFTHMEGSFRHGRGEFFPPTAFEGDSGKEPRATRFTFSDAQPNSCRWDLATPTADGGWRTTWIMEFSRTRSAADTIADGEPIRLPPEEPACAAPPAARAFDPLVGAWRGAGWHTDTSGGRHEVEAELRVSSANRGCATLCFLELRDGDAVWHEFEAWAWHAPAGQWVARALDDREPALEVLVGEFDENGHGTFVQTDRLGAVLPRSRRVHYRPLPGGGLALLHERSADGGASWTATAELELTRQ
jgi:hypothetical protein